MLLTNAHFLLTDIVLVANVANKGRRGKLGEPSVAAARALGVLSCPWHGGTDQAKVFYEFSPSMPALGFVLKSA